LGITVGTAAIGFERGVVAELAAVGVGEGSLEGTADGDGGCGWCVVDGGTDGGSDGTVEGTVEGIGCDGGSDGVDKCCLGCLPADSPEGGSDGDSDIGISP
jgi:hypothetical protein